MHWFWWFWIISFLVTYPLSFVLSRALFSEMKREGWIWPKMKISAAERIRAMLYYVIPFYNILMILTFLFGSEAIKKRAIKQYNLSKVEDNIV